MTLISDTSNDAQGFKYPDQALHELHSAHSDWFAKVQNIDGLVYCLSPEHLESCLKLFRLTGDFKAAEQELANLCDRHHAIGVCCDKFIRLSLLRPQLAWPRNLENLKGFLELGWTESDVAAAMNVPDPTIKINQRLRAAAGRLISMPVFLDAKADIRKLCDDLPAQLRPQLPLARSFKVATTAGLNVESAPKVMADFIVEFDRFCDEWHLLGLATWDLPDVRGPHWVPGFAADDTLSPWRIDRHHAMAFFGLRRGRARPCTGGRAPPSGSRTGCR